MIIKNKQRGVVLVTSLILILVLTLAVSVNMSGILVDEKIIANQKDHFIASEAAEAALREAENKIANQQVEPTNALSDGTTVLPADAAKHTNDTREWWLERDDNWWQNEAIAANVTTATSVSSVSVSSAHQVNYVIETLEHVQDSLVIGQQRDELGRSFYRITARGRGGTSDAKVILQTTYTKRY